MRQTLEEKGGERARRRSKGPEETREGKRAKAGALFLAWQRGRAGSRLSRLAPPALPAPQPFTPPKPYTCQTLPSNMRSRACRRRGDGVDEKRKKVKTGGSARPRDGERAAAAAATGGRFPGKTERERRPRGRSLSPARMPRPFKRARARRPGGFSASGCPPHPSPRAAAPPGKRRRAYLERWRILRRLRFRRRMRFFLHCGCWIWSRERGRRWCEWCISDRDRGWFFERVEENELLTSERPTRKRKGSEAAPDRRGRGSNARALCRKGEGGRRGRGRVRSEPLPTLSPCLTARQKVFCRRRAPPSSGILRSSPRPQRRSRTRRDECAAHRRRRRGADHAGRAGARDKAGAAAGAAAAAAASPRSDRAPPLSPSQA